MATRGKRTRRPGGTGRKRAQQGTSAQAEGRAASARRARAAKPRRWSGRVTESSNAMDLENRVFMRSPKEIARSVKRSAERSKRRKASPFRSAMSMLTFYRNRAGRNLTAERRQAIEKAKQELRKLYGRPG